MDNVSKSNSITDIFREAKSVFDDLPKAGKIFIHICVVFIIAVTLFAADDTPSEADRMRNRIASLQEDISAQMKLVSYAQYSAQKSATQARRSLANGISNPMGASEDDRKNYQGGIDNLQEQGDIADDTFAQLEAEKAEIEKIQQNLAAGVYKEK